MINNSILLLLAVFFFTHSGSSQIFHYEKIYEAVYEGDTICLGPPNGFDCSLHYKSNSIVFADLLGNDGISEGYTPNDYPGGGTLLQLINNGTGDEPCWVINSDDYGGIESLLSASCFVDSPVFSDFNDDGFFDILHGDISTGGGKGGTIHYHEFNPIENKFQLVTDTLWGIDFYDYSNIACNDFDDDGDPDCIVTNGRFEVMSMINLGNGQWAAPDTIGSGATNPSLGFLDDDDYPELLLSSCNSHPCFTQNISLYKINFFGQDSVVWELENEDYIPNTKYTHPKFLYHNEDSLVDLMVYENRKELLLLNTGSSNSADFSQESRFIFPFHLRSPNEQLFVEDLSGNGKKEIFSFLGNIENRIIYEDFGSGIENDWYQINNNIDSFLLSFPNPDSLDIGLSNNYSFGGDLTGDGLNDLIIRVKSDPPFNENRFMLFENTSTNQFKYLRDSTLEAIPNVIDWSQPHIVETDNDDNSELLFRDTAGWQHYEKNPQNNQWETFSGLNTFHEAVISLPIINGILSIVDFDKDGKPDILTSNGPLSFYRRIGELDSLYFKLQPRENYQPIGWDNQDNQLIEPEPIFFANFDGRCGEDMLIKSTCRSFHIYGFRGITPEILSPNANNSFAICDSLAILEAQPMGGSWGGIVEPDGTFQPSEIGIGQFEAIYSYTDAEGCYTLSDTFILNITDCTTHVEEELMSNSSLHQFDIQPNPCEDKFKVLLHHNQPNEIVITLTNILGGKSIKLFDGFEVREKAAYEFTFPSEFLTGVYLIGISINNEKMITKKLVRL